MAGTEKNIVKRVWYRKFKPFYWYDSWYVSYEFNANGEKTVPVGGQYVKPGWYTASWQRNSVPLWNSTSTNKFYSTPSVPYRSDDCWDYISYNNLVNKALNRFGDRKMNLGETLAESKQTWKMVASNATAVAHMFQQLKRGNFRAAANAVGLSRGRNYSRDVSSKYLELIFGWKPLVDEIYAGVDAVQNGLNDHPRHAYITCYAKDDKTFSRTVARTTTRPSGSVQTIGRGRVSYTFLFTHPDYGRTLNQLGLSSPFELAWNLLPHSFLIDWFIPIGDYLGAFYATEGLDFQDAFSTSFCEQKFSGNAGDLAKWPDACSLESGLVQRRVIYDSSPRLPEFELDPTIGKAITATALVLQQRR